MSGKHEIREIFAYMPVQPDGQWWINGCGDQPLTAMGNIQAREGMVSWSECECAGWKVIAVYIRPL